MCIDTHGQAKELLAGTQTNVDEVQERTIFARLHTLKRGLDEKTEAFRAAKVMARESRVQRMLEEARAGAEGLLGFPLKLEHCMNGLAYDLLPAGFVDGRVFDETVLNLREQCKCLEERVKQAKARMLEGGPVECMCTQLRSAESQLGHQRSRLLGYVLAHKPMRDAKFRDKLAAHLDAMLDALLELRALG
jgi:hypothetical protein